MWQMQQIYQKLHSTIYLHVLVTTWTQLHLQLKDFREDIPGAYEQQSHEGACNYTSI